ncbi:hypothetical protein AB0M80_08645 [Amycolatopsis sp. NPDC051045]|uniref:hypothetical protein n=1 Tax=Amycolatopsis sp. NPDC051045 TaxID=3156922 RepID=UPI0034422887
MPRSARLHRRLPTVLRRDGRLPVLAWLPAWLDVRLSALVWLRAGLRRRLSTLRLSARLNVRLPALVWLRAGLRRRLSTLRLSARLNVRLPALVWLRAWLYRRLPTLAWLSAWLDVRLPTLVWLRARLHRRLSTWLYRRLPALAWLPARLDVRLPAGLLVRSRSRVNRRWSAQMWLSTRLNRRVSTLVGLSAGPGGRLPAGWHGRLSTLQQPAGVRRWDPSRLLAARWHRAARARARAARTSRTGTVRHPTRRRWGEPARGRRLLRRRTVLERRHTPVRRERLARAAGEPGRSDVVLRTSATLSPRLRAGSRRWGHAVAALRSGRRGRRRRAMCLGLLFRLLDVTSGRRCLGRAMLGLSRLRFGFSLDRRFGGRPGLRGRSWLLTPRLGLGRRLARRFASRPGFGWRLLDA